MAIALLFLISSFEVIKTIHIEHHHGGEVTVCTAGDETDACHRSLVHLDSTAGCTHAEHIEKVVAACEICDALVRVYVFEVSSDFRLQNAFVEILQKVTPLEKSYSVSLHIPALRGPPVVS